MSSKFIFAWFLAALMLIALIALAAHQFWLTPPVRPLDNANRELGTPRTDDAPAAVPAGYAEVGGVLRAEADITKQPELVLPDYGENTYGIRVGHAPPVDPNTNASTQSVAQALQAPQEYPERLSPMFSAPAFDRAAFEAEPETYLSTIEPGRIWQALAPAEGVFKLKRRGGGYTQLLQGETVRLSVQTVADGAVTFHSFKLGQFDNSLTTQSVRADASGLASVNFTATPGTYGELEILAASPQASGQVNFVVKVELPALTRN